MEDIVWVSVACYEGERLERLAGLCGWVAWGVSFKLEIVSIDLRLYGPIMIDDSDFVFFYCLHYCPTRPYLSFQTSAMAYH